MPKSNPKILLVEDDVALRDAFTIILGTQPYTLDVAANGQEALERCTESTYDIILLDLMMPVLDGVGFLHEADLSETAPSTRIIIMSNLSSGDAITEALSLGAHRQVVKSSLSPKDLIALVADELKK